MGDNLNMDCVSVILRNYICKKYLQSFAKALHGYLKAYFEIYTKMLRWVKGLPDMWFTLKINDNANSGKTLIMLSSNGNN